MKVALIYPPPWKLPEPDAQPDPIDGPPEAYRTGDLDADFHQTPYGLFTLGAAALRAQHQVKVLNLSAHAWNTVEGVIAALDADVFGMSCWTANRRGVALVAETIRRYHAQAHVVVGGPHSTPLAREMLAHHSSIDTICVGESELTFLELLERLSRHQSLQGLAGAWYRTNGSVECGPPRHAIKNLDDLACPHNKFTTHIVMTSRGCPWACTFCGAETSWGRGFRGHSTAYVLDMLESALKRAPVNMLLIKDDTFTTNKKRVLELCRGIQERGIRFLWSCDTRVDVLDEELLKAMRLAGCERLSLGVESGSPAILSAINKKITVRQIESSLALAKRYGIKVRFYMMLGNRGETLQSFNESLDFLARTKPHQYLFSCLSIYPGTADFHEAERAGWLNREDYFSGRFQELKVPFDAPADDARVMSEWFEANRGLCNAYQANLDDCEAILERLGEHAPAELDLATAYYRAGRLADADRLAMQALAHEHPTPGLVLNLRACTAQARGDIEGMKALFLDAARRDPQHAVLIENVQAARRWFAEGGPACGRTLVLSVDHEFRLLERTVQPSLPGPLPEDFADFERTAG